MKFTTIHLTMNLRKTTKGHNMKNILTNFECYFNSNLKNESFKIIPPPRLLRKLARTSRVRPSIKYYSRKAVSLNYCESILEMDGCLRLEFDDSVQRFLTQPFSLKLIINNRLVRYTPDILIEFVDGSYALVEVKPSKKIKEKKLASKLETIRNFCLNELGIPFHILTEKEIHQGKYIANLQQLYPFKDIKISEAFSKKAEESLQSPFTVSALEELCIQKNKNSKHAWAMIAQGFVTFDTNELLIKSSLLNFVTTH